MDQDHSTDWRPAMVPPSILLRLPVLNLARNATFPSIRLDLTMNNISRESSVLGMDVLLRRIEPTTSIRVAWARRLWNVGDEGVMWFAAV